MGGVRELGCSEDGSGRGYLAAAGTRGFTLFVSRGMQRGQGWVPELSDSEASADTSLGAVAPALTGLALSGDAEEVSRPGTRQAPMGPSSSEAGTGNAAQAFTRPPLVASVSGRAETGTAAARAPVHRGISRGRLGATASQQQLMLRGAVFEDLHMSMSEAVRWDDQGAEAYETALPSGHALLTESEDDEKGAWPMRDDDARDAFAAQALRGPSRQPSLRRLASLRANLMALKFVQDRMAEMALREAGAGNDMLSPVAKASPETPESAWDAVDLTQLDPDARSLVLRMRIPGGTLQVSASGRAPRECGAFLLLDGRLTWPGRDIDQEPVSIALVGISGAARTAEFRAAEAAALAACARLAEQSHSDLGLVRCHGVCPLSACGVRGVALVTEAVPFTVEELAEAVLSTSTAASDAFLQSMAVQLANRVLYHHSRITSHGTPHVAASLASCPLSCVAVFPDTPALSRSPATSRHSADRGDPAIPQTSTQGKSPSDGAGSPTGPASTCALSSHRSFEGLPWEGDPRAFAQAGTVAAVRLLPLGSALPACELFVSFGGVRVDGLAPEAIASLECLVGAGVAPAVPPREMATATHGPRGAAPAPQSRLHVSSLPDSLAGPFDAVDEAGGSVAAEMWALSAALNAVAGAHPGYQGPTLASFLARCARESPGERPDVHELRSLLG